MEKMLKKKIDTGKLKVKYVLGMHNTLSSYPDSEDILYELILDYCGRVKKELKFTDVSIKKKYGLSDKKLNFIINKLSKQSLIKPIHDNSAYTTYQVIKNPYQ